MLAKNMNTLCNKKHVEVKSLSGRMWLLVKFQLRSAVCGASCKFCNFFWFRRNKNVHVALQLLTQFGNLKCMLIKTFLNRQAGETVPHKVFGYSKMSLKLTEYRNISSFLMPPLFFLHIITHKMFTGSLRL